MRHRRGMSRPPSFRIGEVAAFVVSLLTREAADELGLAPGMRAIAAVKATNVVIEVPGPRKRGSR